MGEYSIDVVEAAYGDAIDSAINAIYKLRGAALWVESTPHSILYYSYIEIARNLELAANWMYIRRQLGKMDFLGVNTNERPDSAYIEYRDAKYQLSISKASNLPGVMQEIEDATLQCFMDIMNAVAKANACAEGYRIKETITNGAKAPWYAAYMMLLTMDVNKGYKDDELIFIPNSSTYVGSHSSVSRFDKEDEYYGSIPRKDLIPSEFRYEYYPRSGHYEGERMRSSRLGSGQLVQCGTDESGNYIFNTCNEWLTHSPFR